MSDPPRGPVTASGVQRLLDERDRLVARLASLEEVAGRLAVTCPDEVAVADLAVWKLTE